MHLYSIEVGGQHRIALRFTNIIIIIQVQNFEHEGIALVDTREVIGKGKQYYGPHGPAGPDGQDGQPGAQVRSHKYLNISAPTITVTLFKTYSKCYMVRNDLLAL